MSKTVQLTFNDVTAIIEPKQDGMYDLNDIWRVFRLPEKKRPSKWTNADRRNLERSRNLRSVNGDGGTTYATIEALYAYAMWCDFEFYMVVIKTFAQVVERKLEEAGARTTDRPLKMEFGCCLSLFHHAD